MCYQEMPFDRLDNVSYGNGDEKEDLFIDAPESKQHKLSLK